MLVYASCPHLSRLLAGGLKGPSILYGAFSAKDFGWKFLGKVDAAFAWMFSLCPSSLS